MRKNVRHLTRREVHMTNRRGGGDPVVKQAANRAMTMVASIAGLYAELARSAMRLVPGRS